MIMIPMTSPAASADSEDRAEADRFAGPADEGGHGQRGEEAVDHGRDAGEDLENRLGEGAEARRGVVRKVDRRHQPDRRGDEHGDERDEQRADEERDRRRRPRRCCRWPPPPAPSNALCGLQCVPKRKSKNGTFSKKRSDSKISERTMPSVVRMATTEQAMSTRHDEALDELARALPRPRSCARPRRNQRARQLPERRRAGDRTVCQRLLVEIGCRLLLRRRFRRRRCRRRGRAASRMKVCSVAIGESGSSARARSGRATMRILDPRRGDPPDDPDEKCRHRGHDRRVAAVIGGREWRLEMRSPAIAKARVAAEEIGHDCRRQARREDTSQSSAMPRISLTEEGSEEPAAWAGSRQSVRAYSGCMLFGASLRSAHARPRAAGSGPSRRDSPRRPRPRRR